MPVTKVSDSELEIMSSILDDALYEELRTERLNLVDAVQLVCNKKKLATSTLLNHGYFWNGSQWCTSVVNVKVEQDLTTLDVPFGELDRDTQLRLVEHVLDGGACEGALSDSDWVRFTEYPGYNNAVCFYNNYKYRAVAKQPEQPTERETLEAKLHEQWVELNATMKRIAEIK